MTFNRKILLAGVSALILAGIILTLQSSGGASAAAKKTAAPAAPEAVVSTIAQKQVQLWKDFSGRLQAVDYVEIRPEVTGKINEIKFKDGQHVNKGDVLFVIDPAPYEAAVEKSKADLQGAQNRADLAQKDLARAQDLVKTEAISKKIFDERTNGAQVAKSSILSAQAELKKAQIDLDHAYVKAPISGRISRAEITEGNLVQSTASPPLLTSIVSDQGIYADFDVDEKTYLDNIYTVARDNESQAKIPVQIVLKSDESKPYQGVIDSFDNKIDPKSGTIRVRAFLENKDQALLPGMFVNARLGSTGMINALMVPERAIGTDQDRKFVYVIDDGNKVAYREIKIGDSLNGERIVTSGLKPGETIITEGVMKMHPDMVVTPKPETADASGPGPVPAAEPSAQ